MSNTYIYIIQDINGFIKIGHSKNVNKRLKQLQTAHRAKLKLIAYAQAPTYIEKRLHKMFFYHRCNGEWFECTQELLNTLIEYLQERYPTEIYV